MNQGAFSLKVCNWIIKYFSIIRRIRISDNDNLMWKCRMSLFSFLQTEHFKLIEQKSHDLKSRFLPFILLFSFQKNTKGEKNKSWFYSFISARSFKLDIEISFPSLNISLIYFKRMLKNIILKLSCIFQN